MQPRRWPLPSLALAIALLPLPALGQDLPALFKAAEAGDARAQTTIGYYYESGRGLPRDYAMAFKYYSQGAQAGFPRAVNNLGIMYRNGSGVARDYNMAFKYFSQAAQTGDIEAISNLGYMYENGLGMPRDYGLAFKYYMQSAPAGEPRAQTSLGYLYANGLGVAQDYAAALRYYSLAAAKNYPRAISNLGALYANGQGVPRDYALAFQYYTQAAQAGDTLAMNNLGNLYEYGLGLPADYAMAFQYYSRAAQAGLPLAQNNLGQLYKNGRGVPKDTEKAANLFVAAAKAGNGASFFNLGLMLRDGLDGVPQDTKLANDFFRQAVSLGYTQAASFIITPAATRNFTDREPVPAPRAAPVVLTGARAPAGPRLALVIANGNYAPNLNTLKNPVNDGKLIAGALTRAGFAVTVRANLNVVQMKDALAKFTDALRSAGPNTTALFYYAGHGAAAQGVNYLIPVGQEIRNETALQTYGQSADEILALLDSAKPVTTIVILDACRNVPYSGTRGGGGGLNQMNARNGSIIAYSTAPGKTAADGDGADSPYAAALAELIRQSNEPVEIVFRRVRAKVIGVTQNEQTPWESTSLVSDFSFLPR